MRLQILAADAIDCNHSCRSSAMQHYFARLGISCRLAIDLQLPWIRISLFEALESDVEAQDHTSLASSRRPVRHVMLVR